jgi:hypothetical protein
MMEQSEDLRAEAQAAVDETVALLDRRCAEAVAQGREVDVYAARFWKWLLLFQRWNDDRRGKGHKQTIAAAKAVAARWPDTPSAGTVDGTATSKRRTA